MPSSSIRSRSFRASWSSTRAPRSSSSASRRKPTPARSNARCKTPRTANSPSSTVDRKQRKRNPAPPFTTSTLQQEAARKLGFSAQKTMRVAQQLYEGVDIGEGQVGLITYMRTDSLNLAQEAIGQIRDVIVQLYGQEGLAEEPRIYAPSRRTRRKRTRRSAPRRRAFCPADIEKKLESRSVPPVFADLEAHRGLPDGAGDLRYGRGGNARGRATARSAPCCAPTARPWSSPATSRSTRKAWTTSCRTTRITCCRRCRRAIGSS